LPTAELPFGFRLLLGELPCGCLTSKVKLLDIL